MPIYRDWNNAIADHFARITPRGGAFYLAVDEDALAEIGATAFPHASTDAVVDFKRAVRNWCVSQHGVSLPRPGRDEKTNAPRCLAFLAAMSLAAHKMAPDDATGDNNYFTRLREVLGLPTFDKGRPRGLLPAGVEERLWEELNVWARGKGWLPTAERGDSDPTKYVNYPLSQGLLRDGDKKKLDSAFRRDAHRLTRYADRERVAAWFFNNDAGFSTSHMVKLTLGSADRFDGIVDAVYDVYASVDWDSPENSEGVSSRRTRSRTLQAGLYRDADPLISSVFYLLYPRRQSQSASGLSAVRDNGDSEPLERDSDGAFLPLWDVDPAGGKAWRVTGSDLISEMRLPQREFWVLTRDNPDDEFGDFASRGSPQLGEEFILLCRDSVAIQMKRLREYGLVKWEGEPENLPEYAGWVEFRKCEIRYPGWSDSMPSSGLSDELRPRGRASISLQGGLKAAGRDSWLEGYAPTLWVSSLDDCRARIYSASQVDADPAMDESAPNFSPIALPNLEPDDYWLEVLVGEIRADRRFIRVISWDSLMLAEPAKPFGTPIGDAVLRGALLTPSANATDR